MGRRPGDGVVTGWERVGGGSEPLSAGDDDLAAACYLGRGPQIQPWMTGRPFDKQPLSTMSAKLAWADRHLHRLTERWIGRVRLAEAGQIALIVRVAQGGAAWHNDRLNELLQLTVVIDGRRCDVRPLPYRTHEQAG